MSCKEGALQQMNRVAEVPRSRFSNEEGAGISAKMKVGLNHHPQWTRAEDAPASVDLGRTPWISQRWNATPSRCDVAASVTILSNSHAAFTSPACCCA